MQSIIIPAKEDLALPRLLRTLSACPRCLSIVTAHTEDAQAVVQPIKAIPALLQRRANQASVQQIHGGLCRFSHRTRTHLLPQ